MILKLTVLKNGDDVFSVHIDVRDQTELSTGVKAALDEFQRLSPKTKLLGGDILILLDKVKALPLLPKLPKLSKVDSVPKAPELHKVPSAPIAAKPPKVPKVRKKATAPTTAPALAPEVEAELV
jgi:hypothetical protein